MRWRPPLRGPRRLSAAANGVAAVLRGCRGRGEQQIVLRGVPIFRHNGARRWNIFVAALRAWTARGHEACPFIVGHWDLGRHGPGGVARGGRGALQRRADRRHERRRCGFWRFHDLSRRAKTRGIPFGLPATPADFSNSKPPIRGRRDRTPLTPPSPPAPPAALLSYHITRGCGPWLITYGTQPGPHACVHQRSHKTHIPLEGGGWRGGRALHAPRSGGP